jgi:hypothetical protein
VVGDGDGRIGNGQGKAKEVAGRRAEGMEQARRNMVKVRLKKGTLHHAVEGKHGLDAAFAHAAGVGLYRRSTPAARMRAVFEVVGVTNILAKVPRPDQPVQRRARDAARSAAGHGARPTSPQARNDGRSDHGGVTDGRDEEDQVDAGQGRLPVPSRATMTRWRGLCLKLTNQHGRGHADTPSNAP